MRKSLVYSAVRFLPLLTFAWAWIFSRRVTEDWGGPRRVDRPVFFQRAADSATATAAGGYIGV